MMFVTMILSLSAFAVWQAAAAPLKVIPPCPCYSLNASPEQQTAKIGAPVRITVTVTNTVDHDIYVFSSFHPEDLYFVDVKDANGVRLRMTDRYSDITNLLHAKVSGQTPRPRAYRDKNGKLHIETYGGSAPPTRTVKPGGEVQVTILLNDLYILDKAGTYTVQIKKLVGQKEIDSNVVTITLTD